MRFGVGTAVAADAIVAVCSIATLAVVARTFTPADFGLYTVGMRVVGLLQAPLLIGIGISLPRRLPSTRSRPDAAALVSSASGILLAVCLGVLAVSAVLPGLLARITFGSSQLTGDLRGLAAMVVGSLLHALSYAVLRGSLRFAAASSLLGLNIGVVPLVAALISGSPVHLFLLIGGSWTAISVASITAYLSVNSVSRPVITSLLRVGWSRVPGDFAIFALPALPALYVLHTSGAADAGGISLAVSMVTLAGTLFTPLSAVLTPQLSHWQDRNAHGEVVSTFRRLRLLLLTTVAIPLIGWTLAPTIIPLVFGDTLSYAVPYIRLALFAAPAYAAYVLTRSFLDGLSDRPVTAYIAALGLGVAVAVLAAAHQLDMNAAYVAIAAMLAGFWTLGSLTYLFAHRVLTHL